MKTWIAMLLAMSLVVVSGCLPIGPGHARRAHQSELRGDGHRGHDPGRGKKHGHHKDHDRGPFDDHDR